MVKARYGQSGVGGWGWVMFFSATTLGVGQRILYP